MRNATEVQHRFFTTSILAMIALTLIAFAPSGEAKSYRWVDKNGQVHYSDHLPPQETDRAYSVINQGGVTVDSVDRAKTKEELAEEQRKQQQEAEQKQRARKQAEYDNILLDTYSKVSDLEDTRDRYIATLEGAIKVAQHKLSNLNSELEQRRKSAANLERDGKPVSDELSKDIAILQTQVDRENSFIQAQRSQQADLRKKFAADIERYKKLKGEQ